ncbi:MAG: hypothetical protein M0024_11200 [Nitrospiraceae bacterium]|nr:hypothetical protein [Nitrospiraceae bacterium]
MATAEKGSPEIKERLANVLVKLGSAQAKHGTLVELLLSFPMFYSAAEIRGDKSAQEQYSSSLAFTSTLVHLNLGISSFAWPIRSLVIDSTRLATKNEVAFYQLFTDEAMPAELLQLLRK